jgi:hypothetical protein
MTEFGEQNGDEFNRQNQEAENRIRNWQQERMSFRPKDATRYPEILHPEDLRQYANTLHSTWIERYYKSGGMPPPQFIYDNLVTTGYNRKKELRDLMAHGNYEFSPDEKQAGLWGGVVWEPLDIAWLDQDKIRDKDIRIDKSTDPVTGNQRDYLFVDNQPVAIYRDNRKLLALQGGQDEEDITRGVRSEVGSIIPEEVAVQRRESLAAAIEDSLERSTALYQILTKDSELATFSGDVKLYASERWKRLGKMVVEMRRIGKMFDAPPTREGFAPFGEKASIAFEAWRELAEGRGAVITTHVDPETGQEIQVPEFLPNLFADTKNFNLQELCRDYVVKRIEESTHPYPMPSEALKKSNIEDSEVAAMFGMLLVDLFDVDASSALQIVKEGGTLDDAKIAGAFVDKWKMIYLAYRRIGEFEGEIWKGEEKRRNHPRQMSAGAPVSLYLVPGVSSNFLDMATVDVFATNVGTGEKKIISVTVDQRAYGTKNPDKSRGVYDKDGKRVSRFRKADVAKDSYDDTDFWEYEVVGLQDKSVWEGIFNVVEVNGEKKELPAESRQRIEILDPNKAKRYREIGLVQVRVLDGEGNALRMEYADKVEGRESELEATRAEGEIRRVIRDRDGNVVRRKLKNTEIGKGLDTAAQEVPVGLMDMYSHDGIFTELTRGDLDAQYAELAGLEDQNLTKTKDLNKKMSARPLATANQLSTKTADKYEEFTRIVVAAGATASVVKADGDNSKMGKERTQQHQLRTRAARDRAKAIEAMERGILSSGFVRSKFNGSEFVWADQADKDLFYKLINGRGGGPFKPNELGYFNSAEWEELKPMYEYLYDMGILK